jgi:predicted secreted protein
MAQPDIIRGTYFVLAMGDGGTPTEVFTALCGLTTRNLNYTANTTDVFTRDCAEPAEVPIRRALVTGEQWTLSGSGSLNRENIDTILAAKGTPKNYRFYWTEPADDEVYAGYFEGQAILSSISIDGNDDNFAQISVEFTSDGEFVFYPTAGS